MSNSPKVKQAIKEVLAELKALPKEELLRLIDEHKTGEWAEILKPMFEPATPKNEGET